MGNFTYRRLHILTRADPVWVVIPCRNEAAHLQRCLDAFLTQTSQNFCLVIVVNASTDASLQIAYDWANAHPERTVAVIQQRHAGIGPACRSGCAYALRRGARVLARTDADSVVDSDWIHQLQLSLVDGAEYVVGRCRAESGSKWLLIGKAMVMFRLIEAGLLVARLKRNLPITAPVLAGFNMALTAELYQKVGGFSSQPTVNEDVELQHRILAVTRRGCYNRKMIVRTSLRRLRQHGLRASLRWYFQRGC